MGGKTAAGSTRGKKKKKKKKRLLLYLPLDGGREIGQCLVLIWQPTGLWFCSDSLEALSHTITKLSLLSNSFAPLEHNCLRKVQLEHRVTAGQGTTNPTCALGYLVVRSARSSLEGMTRCGLCLAAALCSAGRSPAPVKESCAHQPWCWESGAHSDQTGCET